jgi:hypothetical protein
MRQHSQVQCFQKVDQAQNIQDRNSRSFPLPINRPPTRWEGDPTRTKGNYTTDLSNGISEHRIETRALKGHGGLIMVFGGPRIAKLALESYFLRFQAMCRDILSKPVQRTFIQELASALWASVRCCSLKDPIFGYGDP